MAVTATETYSTSVAHVADQVSQKETVTATETCSMSVEHVADQVSQRETVTATETYSMSVALVADQVSQKGDCDCDGNQLDALGVCGGDCTADADGNGICDDAESGGCTDATACNYDSSATQDDGSCDYCSCLREAVAYTLTVEASTPAVAPGTTYRFYVDMTDASDRFSAIFGTTKLLYRLILPTERLTLHLMRVGVLQVLTLLFLDSFQRWQMIHMLRSV